LKKETEAAKEFIFVEKDEHGIRLFGVNKSFLYALLGFVVVLIMFYSILSEFSTISTFSNNTITELAGEIMRLDVKTDQLKHAVNQMSHDLAAVNELAAQRQDDGSIVLVDHGRTYMINIQALSIQEIK
jgi:outer membrane murein-binding lipoprotein Lpp